MAGDEHPDRSGAGEEIKIGKRTVRHGLTRFARDPQRMVNYYSSAEAEVVALQPKSPWLATEKNVEQHRRCGRRRTPRRIRCAAVDA
jgi:hypothetical protein